jgi:hypothetical protein
MVNGPAKLGHAPALSACRTVAFFQIPLALLRLVGCAADERIEPLYRIDIFAHHVIVPVPAVILYILNPERETVSGVVFPALPLTVSPALTAEALGYIF